MMIALLLVTLLSDPVVKPTRVIQQSEQSMYAADFDRAMSVLDTTLSTPGLDPDARLELLLQQLRVQQNARLAGVTLGDEATTMAEVKALAGQTRNQDLAGQAQLRLAVSRYFTLLLTGNAARATEFVPEFQRAARLVDTPCLRAEALFFAALMPQVAGQVAQSKPGLEAAQAAAKDCPLEQSYVDRHLAVVAEDAGDLAAARNFAARSSAERRRIGFQIFLPFSLMLEADLEDKAGNVQRAQALLLEAAEMAKRLRLPAAQRAVCAETSKRTLASPHCVDVPDK